MFYEWHQLLTRYFRIMRAVVVKIVKRSKITLKTFRRAYYFIFLGDCIVESVHMKLGQIVTEFIYE
mgnify:CR=1 FL=1